MLVKEVDGVGNATLKDSVLDGCGNRKVSTDEGGRKRNDALFRNRTSCTSSLLNTPQSSSSSSPPATSSSNATTLPFPAIVELRFSAGSLPSPSPSRKGSGVASTPSIASSCLARPFVPC